VALLAPRVAERGLAISAQWSPGTPGQLVGDEGRLRQILLNILSNAVKFTHAGGITIEVDGEEVAGGLARLRIRIRDTGIGIPPEMLGRVFEQFTQADGSTSRRYGGTGLGLTIASQLAAMMGGRLGVESRVGAGSTFWLEVTLPLATPSLGGTPEALWNAPATAGSLA
jgi:two-component system sensor histidine kinase/response regulator